MVPLLLVTQYLLALAAAAPVAVSVPPSEDVSTVKTVRASVADPLNAKIELKDTKFVTQVKAGSNKKEFLPVVDGGSGQLWLPNTDGWASLSSSLKKQDKDYTTNYATFSVKGYYVYDDLEIAGKTVKGLLFGVVDNPSSAGNNKGGVLGLAKRSEKDTLPYKLKEQGLIDQTIASIFFLDLQSSGELIFGGHDRAKAASAWKSFDSPGQYWQVPVSKMKIDGQDITNDANTKFVTDLGAEISYFPRKFIDKLVPLFNGRDLNNGYWLIDCNQPKDKSFDIQVGDITIKVPFSTFIWPTGNSCFMGAGDADKLGYTLLGNNVLRNVYTAFDYDNQQVHLAELKDSLDVNVVALL